MKYRITGEFDQLENRIIYWVERKILRLFWWPVCSQKSEGEAQTTIDNLKRINAKAK